MARPIQKREDIERGVVKVVSRRGLHAVTIQDIADEAGVSPGLLHRYWKGRDDLAAEVYCEIHRGLLDRLNSLTATTPEVWDKLRLAVRAFLAFASSSPVELRFLLLSQHDLAATLPAEQSFHLWLRRLIAEGMAQGRLRKMDADVASQLMLGVVLEPVIGSIYGRVRAAPMAMEGEIVAAVERVLGLDGGSTQAAIGGRSRGRREPASPRLAGVKGRAKRKGRGLRSGAVRQRRDW